MIAQRRPVILDGRFATIPLGRGLFVIVDFKNYDYLSRVKWRAVRSQYCWYVVRRVRKSGQEKNIYMHRVIMHTPSNMECHHRNRYTLDCREENLENKLPAAHAAEHGRTVC